MVKYYVATPQGISLSPMITAYNLSAIFSSGAFPSLPNYSAKIRVFDKVKDWIPQKGFNAVYKSLVNDLSQIGKLGEYHDILTSQVLYHRDAAFFTSKIEDSQFMKLKSYWKIPM